MSVSVSVSGGGKREWMGRPGCDCRKVLFAYGNYYLHTEKLLFTHCRKRERMGRSMLSVECQKRPTRVSKETY